MAKPVTGPERFFLPSRIPADDHRFRPPPRSGVKLVPLIDAKSAYVEMEQAILAARSTVHMCWWEFDPFTELVSRDVRRAIGASLWVDLLAAKADGRRVAPAHVRMIIADCDAVFFSTMHAKAWSALDIVLGQRAGLSAAAQGRLEAFVGIHPARVSIGDLGFVVRGAVESAVTAGLEQRRDELNAIIEEGGADAVAIDDARDEFRRRPGLWPNIVFDAATDRFRLADVVTPALRAATHHQKLCLVDGEIGFCGGLDIAPERMDDGRHRVASPWHDVQCRVEGAPVFDLERNFFSRWNTELPRYRTFVADSNAAQPPLRLARPSCVPMTKPGGAAAFSRRPGKSHAQMIRTVSGEVPAGDLLPETIRRDIEECYLNAIAQAEEYIYIENQYVRWLPLADAIVERHRIRAIKVILVVPTLPEEVRAPRRDAITEHGLFLQREFLQRLAAGLGTDFGLFALAQKRASAAPDPLDLFGSAQVYVHSKLMIVDDAFATIGSTNANGRGLFVDSELNMAWADPSAVRVFRLKLWSELLGRPRDLASWKPAHFVEKWRIIAAANRVAAPAARRGFVVPIDLAVIDPGSAFPLPFPEIDKAS